ncbi:MAG: fimbria/pilus periplasmic chaperone [Alcanivorax sp.]|nr:fimbria/pilus periplasmic chaperone [Alcanivorax sp.]
MQDASIRLRLTPCLWLFSLLSAWLLTANAQAGNLHITPLRLNLDENTQTTQLSIENQSLQPVTLQASIMRWRQQGDQDLLQPSNDIFVSPPILRLSPGGHQVLRLKYMGNMPARREIAYRLYLQDTAARANRNGGANMAIRIGLPVFVSPSTSHAEPKVQTRYQNGTWRVLVSNTGNAHFRVIGIDAFGANADRNKLKKDDVLGQSTQAIHGFPYVFPDQTREWHLKAPANAQLRIRTDVYGRHQQGFDRRGMAWLGEPENNKTP